ncbi:glycoside hydrolase family 88 protein [Reichenbachiella ulvae]|uniref:Glycoside hydrolase family 88 protein n=1 Tax=Reichenbachiella ulvae TaxID=2980104 RepID=A0ABT3CV76_9BACT|nr:glycoside hydrolase family 88 protein [Reichenbachiella ulvae]MCV9387375.1 glycoside hydrolase family 88 protein [Reichenbachiella ulvae]
MSRILREFLSYGLIIFLGLSCTPKEEKKLNVDQILQESAEQYSYMSSLLEEDRFPTTYENGKLKSSRSDWWCSGFYPGTLLYLYEATQNPELLAEVKRILVPLEKEKNNTGTHDLGFMMFCSFGNAHRISPADSLKEIIRTSSVSLSTRFDPAIGCIRSWDPAPWNSKWQYPVIIDNMMNLEMLLWSAAEFNIDSLKQIAVTHADTTLKNHFRKDFSSYHVVSYDTLTGQVEMKNTDQGYADESSWARGQAWGLYGYTVMYRYTKDPKYLTQATGIADYILNHPNLPADKVPYWDFNAPDIPEADRDASAAAIMASALLELTDLAKNKEYFVAAEQMLSTLSSEVYRGAPQTNGGFILKHSVGNMPDGNEVDVPLSYADYYYVEALMRYKNRKSKES